MFSQTFYLIRSRADGQYLVARPQRKTDDGENRSHPGYVLLFKEHFDALSYLNTHGAEVVEQFAVESMPGSQLGNLLNRWGFLGIGLVQDPLVPQIQFLQQANNF